FLPLALFQPSLPASVLIPGLSLALPGAVPLPLQAFLLSSSSQCPTPLCRSAPQRRVAVGHCDEEGWSEGCDGG
ncbi:MAG: hypothetical protein Q4F47_09285, partial [Bacteroidaceae bacterium]|nr:hypothetical protein [Bacteroidaceae bacterium]